MKKTKTQKGAVKIRKAPLMTKIILSALVWLYDAVSDKMMISRVVVTN